MPVNLTPRDVSADLADFKSVLIASCPVCPTNVSRHAEERAVHRVLQAWNQDGRL